MELSIIMYYVILHNIVLFKAVLSLYSISLALYYIQFTRYWINNNNYRLSVGKPVTSGVVDRIASELRCREHDDNTRD